MVTLAEIPPKDRLNVGAVLDPPDREHPRRLGVLPKYHCPSCNEITAFSMLEDVRTHHEFDPFTPTDAGIVVVDAACRNCHRRFRVIADLEEPHPACYAYDVRYVIEASEAG